MKLDLNYEINNYISLLEDNLYNFNKEIDANLLQKNVIEAMNYSLSVGGKRIRPILVMEFCKMLGGDINKAIPFACAIEMVHTFSLIHDDLPCMDNDDYRRGKPSCHKVYGEATALLAGDALSTYALEIISDAALKGLISYECSVKGIKTLSNAIGIYGMIGGQVIDIENEHRSISLEALRILQSCKTGALIRAACELGCISAGANQEKTNKAIEYAENLGLAFQIVDDILDVVGDEELLGKPIGSDEKQSKTTYVTLLGLDGAKELAEKYTKNSLNILNTFENNDFLIALTKDLLIRNK